MKETGTSCEQRFGFIHKIYRYMTSILKNVYLDKLYDIVTEYNNTYHSTIKLRPVDVKSSTYIDFNVEYNDKDFKFEVGSHVQISRYNIFAKGFAPSWSKVVFLIKTVPLNIVPFTYIIEDLKW